MAVSVQRCARIVVYSALLTAIIRILLYRFPITVYYSKQQEKTTTPKHRLQEQLARTPPMGWNSWNKFACDGLNEDLVKRTADALVKTGLAKAGYIYVNLDDCWQGDRDSSGNIQPDKTRFEHGMVHLGNYIHSKGLRFGLYTNIGGVTCQRRPGSYGHEEKDAQMYASWGVDFVKNDDCFKMPTLDIFQDHQKMWNAIIHSNRSMIHSVKPSVDITKAHLVSHMRRVGWEIKPTWDSVLSLIDKHVEEDLGKYSRPGFWNDLEMLEVGNDGLSESENVAHMSLWCAFKSPLLLGNDVRRMSNFTFSLLTHNELLSVLKDPLGKSVQRVYISRAIDGSAQDRVISKKCSSKDPRQVWRYDPQNKSLINQYTSKCLTKGWKNYTYLEECSHDVDTQRWTIDFNARQIHKSKSLCLNTQPVFNGGAKVSGCFQRRGPEDFSKQNWYSNVYNDALRMEIIASNTFVFGNSRGLCLTFGGPPELNIFAGPLAADRYVTVFLNRDNRPRDITLKWTYLPDFSGVIKTYVVRDIYRRRDLGVFTEAFTSIIEPHSVLIATLTPT